MIFKINFYTISYSTDTDVGSVFPQVSDVRTNSLEDNPFSQRNLSYDTFPDFKPQFDDHILDEKTRLTDFISQGGSFGGFGFIVSEKVKKIFSPFAIPKIRFYPIPLCDYKGNKIDNYFWLQILATGEAIIDFNKSKFLLKRLNKVINIFKSTDTENFKELLKSKKSLERVFIEELHLNEQYLTQCYDVLAFKNISPNIIITEKLKSALQNNNITGIKYSDKLNIFVD